MLLFLYENGDPLLVEATPVSFEVTVDPLKVMVPFAPSTRAPLSWLSTIALRSEKISLVAPAEVAQTPLKTLRAMTLSRTMRLIR
jgi:hypothetical protein